MAKEQFTSQGKKIFRLDWTNSFGLGKEKDFFLDSLAMLFASGMDILYSLESIREGMKNKIMKKALDSIIDQVREGVPLWKSFEATNIVNPQTIALIRIGEETGKLPENLKVIVEQQGKDRASKARIRSAMMYPVLVLVLTLVLGVGIAWFILPKLTSVFTSLKLELPLTTQIMIRVAEFLQANGVWFVPIFFFVIFLLLYLIFIYSKTKFIGQWILRHTPVIKNLIQEVEIARFGYILGTLLDAGIPIIEAINALSEASEFRIYKNTYAQMKQGIQDGKSFREIFKEIKRVDSLIPFQIQNMVSAAEQSGKLQNTLMRIAAIYEEKSELTTKNLSILLEPMMLIVIFSAVLSVALAVITPVYSLIGNFGTATRPTTQKSAPAKPNRVANPDDSEAEPKQMVEIIETGTGELNVRLTPKTNGTLLGKVKVGEKFEYLTKEFNWYHIIYDPATSAKGWVSGSYVKELTSGTEPEAESEE